MNETTPSGRRLAPAVALAFLAAALGWACAKYGHDAYLDAIPRRLNHCLQAAPVTVATWAALGAAPLLEIAAAVGAVRLLRPTTRPGTAPTVAAALLLGTAALLLVVTGWSLADALGGLDHPLHTCTGM
ncbi:hypothetical protein ACGFX4_02580 [Kitasatospora sp. NPDC048365]|uniref:hypothetical protein n=1 Tax=Kitasatospora sp. NPDC048365 TaxID=3364050 RepID=UPI00371AA15E